MKQTDNLKMNLPEESDVVDIEQLNDNFRKIDAELPTNYAVNDPNQPGYIANRPCYFTGKTIEETLMDAVSVEIGAENNYSGKPMKAGETYRLTIKGTTVELTAFTETADGVTGTVIGDSVADFAAAQKDGAAPFVPKYGYSLYMVNTMVALITTDGTGEMLKAAFGLTAEELAAKNVSVTLTHPVPETVKLDKRLLPDDIGASPIKIIDIGSGSFDPNGIDFTQYSPGDVILVVGNM
jgi:hypothetical protein